MEPVTEPGAENFGRSDAGGMRSRILRVVRCVPWRWVVLLAIAEVTVLALLAAVAAAPARPAIFLALVLVATSVPIALVGTYLASLRRAHDLRLFHGGGRLRMLLGGRSFRWLRWLALSLTLAVVLFVGASATSRPIPVALLAPLVLGLVFLFADCLLRREVEAPHRRALALRAAVVIAPLLLVMVDFSALVLWGDIPRYATLSEAVRATIPQDAANSPTVDELLRLSGYVTAIEAFALGRVGEWGGAMWLVACLGVAALGVTFYAALSRALAVIFVPWAELRRGLLPASDTPVSRRLSAIEIGLCSALATVLVLFVAVPVLAAAEGWLRQNMPPSRYVKTMVDEIDGRYFRPGTIEILTKLQTDTVKGIDVDQDGLVRAANAGFDAMEGNVDLYLDAYYSLPAEYMRIVGLVGGQENLEQQMATNLNQRLMAGNPFGGYEARLDEALSSVARVRDIYDEAVGTVLVSTSIDLPADARVEIVARTERSGLGLPSPDLTLTTTGVRAGAGAAAGLVAALIVKKVAAKGTLKLASKVFVKVVLSKAASTSGGTAAGAAAGALVGSAVPVLGTAAGAVVGGIVGGLSVGVGVDYLMLKLEENLSRERFRAEIIAAIEHQREEFLAGLDPQR